MNTTTEPRTLDDLLNELDVTLDVTYVGEHRSCETHPDWHHHHYATTLLRNGRPILATDYHTGAIRDSLPTVTQVFWSVLTDVESFRDDPYALDEYVESMAPTTWSDIQSILATVETVKEHGLALAGAFTDDEYDALVEAAGDY